MGFKTEINWVLKVKENLESLKAGEIREFIKDSPRVYPINIPIFLVDKEWAARGYVTIQKSEVTGASTKVTAKIEKVFGRDESSALTKVFRKMYGG